MLRLPRPVGTLSFIAAWLVPWRPAFRVRSAQSGLSFFAHHRDVSGRHIAKYGAWEPLLTRWISDHLAASPTGIFIDVGANIGWHVIHAAQHSAVEIVVAFEPDAFNSWLLDRNLRLNRIDKAVVNTCAVGAKRGTTLLHRYKNSNHGRHSLLVDYGYGSRAVPLTDLDNALDTLGLADRRVLILKIDVEGYEPAVIAGATRTLARTDVVVTEYSPNLSRSGGLSTDAMRDVLLANGFAPNTLRPDGRLKALTAEDLRGLNGQIDVVWTRRETKI